MKLMDAFPQENKPTSTIPLTTWLRRNTRLKFTRHQFWYLRTEIDMWAVSSDSEEGTAPLIQERWWQNGQKRNSEIWKELKEWSLPQLDLLSSRTSWLWTSSAKIWNQHLNWETWKGMCKSFHKFTCKSLRKCEFCIKSADLSTQT